jgi:hypothetical protein
MEDYNCPHCNAVITPEYNADSPEQSFEVTSCCNRTIVILRQLVPTFSIGVPSAAHMKEHSVTGDTSDVPGMPKLDHMRPNSNWTIVMWDLEGWSVRICPKNVDGEALGRPWGLALARLFTSPFEAHLFADSMDGYLDAAFSHQSELHKDYRGLLVRMNEALQALETGDIDTAKSLLDMTAYKEFVEEACALYWKGGYDLYADPNSAIGKMMALEQEGKSYRCTHLVEVMSRHDTFFPDQETYEKDIKAVPPVEL